MKSMNEENPANDLKSTTQGQKENTTAKFQVSYNDAEKMINNDYDRRIEHRSEIVFRNNFYTTPSLLNLLPRKFTLPECFC